MSYLLENNGQYHKECYKKVVHTTNLERLRIRVQKRGRLIEEDENSSFREEEPPTKLLRSNSYPFDKDLCIICQKPGGYLRKVACTKTGETMLACAETIGDKDLLLRLNNVPDATDAVANDAQYHLLCWTKLKKENAKITRVGDFDRDLDDPLSARADIEIIDLVDALVRNEQFVDMKSVNTTYNNILVNSEENHSNYKRYLKMLLSENVPNLIFSRPKKRRESEIICSDKSKDEAI